ncbi:Crp/Fnr family transcriptional regulator [Sinorhizobium americanum]|uniref:Crp/Fnr family transcriptional regulator n=1 Tax=Sinorhizobium americanum TaxID=194963 RepID=UPI001F47CB19|nr:cyclic nucleotide-binding domain-containing protein [Sinorhizobium americanum]
MTRSPDFLSRLDNKAVAALSERWIVRSYAPQELIIAHGESGRDVFFILEGHARVTLFSTNGREVLYGDRGPGDIVGELAAIDGKARSATVLAIDATRAARLPAKDFRSLIAEPPPGVFVGSPRIPVGGHKAHDRPGLRVQYSGRASASHPRIASPR